MSVQVTEGAGKTIGTETISGSEYQLIKLVDSTAASTTRTGVAANPLQVSLANTAANSTAVKTDGSAVTQPVSIATNTPVGNVAHDAADSGAPIKMGAKAEATPSTLTLVADADRTDLYADLDGIQMIKPYTSHGDIVSGNASNTDGTSTQVIAAQASGIKTYLTTIILTNTSSTNTYCEIKDGSTTKLTIPVPSNGGAIVNLPVPLGGTAATAWNFDMGTAVTTAYCSMVGFKSKV